MGSAQKQVTPAHTEYVVYTFGQPGQDHPQPGIWEKKASHAAIGPAVRQAEELYKTGHYHKVEIKQKYFDQRCNRNIDCTLRTLGQKKRRGDIYAAFAVAFASVCGIVAFVVTYFMLYGG